MCRVHGRGKAGILPFLNHDKPTLGEHFDVGLTTVSSIAAEVSDRDGGQREVHGHLGANAPRPRISVSRCRAGVHAIHE